MTAERAIDPSTEVRLRPYRPGDEHAILETFNLVFREVCGEGYVDRTLEEWRWEFAANPEGLRIVIGVCPDGTVACQYAGVPLRIWAGAASRRELRFFHAVDSMVHPRFRRGLRKKSLFVEVAERFFAMYGGSADDLGFGYPVRTAWRIGERFLGYRLVRVVDFLRRPVGGPCEPRRVRVDRCEVFPTEVDDLWLALRDEFELTTVRDLRYLTWRYVERPGAPYTILVASRGNDLTGVAVVRTDGGLAPGSATIGDLLVEPGDRETLAALVEEADRLADERDCTHLMTVENPALPNARVYEELGFVPEPSAQWLERKLGARDWTSGFDPAWLAEHWTYALGDSDLF